jgi:hypothetical protein
MRVMVAIGVVLLVLVCLLPVAVAAQMLEVKVGRGDVRSGPGAA